MQVWDGAACTFAAVFRAARLVDRVSKLDSSLMATCVFGHPAGSVRDQYGTEALNAIVRERPAATS